jgi:methyl-accepting chemotaxis protein
MIAVQASTFRSVRMLRIVVGGCFAVACASGVFSIYLMGRMASSTREALEIGIAATEANALYAQGLQMCQATRNILLDPANQTAYSNHASAVTDFKDVLGSLSLRAGRIFPGATENEALAGIGRDFELHVVIQRRIQEKVKQGAVDEAKQILNREDTPLWRKYKASILDYGKWVAQHGSNEIQRHSRMAQGMAWISGILLALAGLAAYLISGGVAKRLQELAQVLTAGAREMSAVSQRISSFSGALAHNSGELVSSLQATSSSGEEIRAMANRNSENSTSAADLAEKSRGHFTRARQVLGQMEQAMEGITRSSDKISQINRVIDEIAFQTNILALNAAVEAARAGQAGMGFGVVADEVRTLAQRCAQASRDTADLIDESRARSQEGRTRVGEVAVTIGSITDESDRIRLLVTEVNAGSREQAQGVDQISQAIARIERSNRETAAAATDGASAAEELHAQS